MIQLLTSLRRFGALAVVALAGLLALPAFAPSQAGVSISISKVALLGADGAVTIKITIACRPLEGTLDFQEGFAGVSQESTGAWSESGIDGAVVCDGVPHIHTAHLFPFESAFERGPAAANAAVIVCHLVDDQQICINGSTAREIFIRGPLLP